MLGKGRSAAALQNADRVIGPGQHAYVLEFGSALLLLLMPKERKLSQILESKSAPGRISLSNECYKNSFPYLCLFDRLCLESHRAISQCRASGGG